jgi:hypothetical protein
MQMRAGRDERNFFPFISYRIAITRLPLSLSLSSAGLSCKVALRAEVVCIISESFVMALIVHIRLYAAAAAASIGKLNVKRNYGFV